jgi:hypothetical protein
MWAVGDSGPDLSVCQPRTKLCQALDFNADMRDRPPRPDARDEGFPVLRLGSDHLMIWIRQLPPPFRAVRSLGSAQPPSSARQGE